MASFEPVPSHCEMQFLSLTKMSSQILKLQTLLPPGLELEEKVNSETMQIRLCYEEILKPLPYKLKFSIDERPLVLEVGSSLLMALISMLTPDQQLESIPFEQLPKTIGLALLQSALSQLMADISTMNGLQIRLENYYLDRKPNDKSINDQSLPSCRLMCDCHYGDTSGWVAITFIDEVIDLLENQLSPKTFPRPSTTMCIEKMSLPMSISLGKTQLTHKQISQLETYDVILLKQPHCHHINELNIEELNVEGLNTEEQVTEENQSNTSQSTKDLLLKNQDPLNVEVTIGKTDINTKPLFAGLLQGAQLTITHWSKNVTMEDSTENETNITAQTSVETNVDDQVASLLDDIELEVIFEVARQRATMKDIKALVPGQTFSLHKAVPQAITLMVHGTPIAEAELIQIDDQLGARITRRMFSTQPGSNENHDYDA